jgi:hypothetical protein
MSWRFQLAVRGRPRAVEEGNCQAGLLATRLCQNLGELHLPERGAWRSGGWGCGCVPPVDSSVCRLFSFLFFPLGVHLTTRVLGVWAEAAVIILGSPAPQHWWAVLWVFHWLFPPSSAFKFHSWCREVLRGYSSLNHIEKLSLATFSNFAQFSYWALTTCIAACPHIHTPQSSELPSLIDHPQNEVTLTIPVTMTSFPIQGALPVSYSKSFPCN